MRINDAITGLIIIVFSVLVLLVASTYRGLPGVPYGPGLFPSLIAWCLLLGGGVLVFQGLPRLKVGWLFLDPWAKAPRTYGTLGAIFSALLFYILFSETIGFLITAVAILFPLMLWTRGATYWRSSLIISIFFSLIIYFVFGWMLRVPLPRGLLDGVI
jgi:putative tricarboxylic transport membrane protein